MDHLKCGICGVEKATRAKLRRHIQEKHGTPVRCPLCPRFSATGRTMYRMRRHLEDVHHADASKYFEFRRHTAATTIQSGNNNSSVPSLLSLKLEVPAAYKSRENTDAETLTATAAIPTPQQDDPAALCKINNDDDIDIICTEFEAKKTPKKEDSMYELASICQPNSSPSSVYTPPNPPTPADPTDSCESLFLSPKISLIDCKGEIVLCTTGTEPPLARTGEDNMGKSQQKATDLDDSNLTRLSTSQPDAAVLWHENQVEADVKQENSKKIHSLATPLSDILVKSAPEEISVAPVDNISVPPPLRRLVLKSQFSQSARVKRSPARRTRPSRQASHRTVKLISLEQNYAAPSADPRHFLAGAPSSLCDRFPASPLRRVRREALKQPISSGQIHFSSFPDCLGSVKKVEKATLPDGTTYELTTTWTRDPDFRICCAEGTQTSEDLKGPTAENNLKTRDLTEERTGPDTTQDTT